MAFLDELTRSVDLSTEMTERVGVNLAALLESAPEREARRMRDRVMRCSSCAHQGECASLLATDATLAEAPGYCLNKSELDAMPKG